MKISELTNIDDVKKYAKRLWKYKPEMQELEINYLKKALHLQSKKKEKKKWTKLKK